MHKLDELRFTQTHEWVKIEDDVATIGITEHAQDMLGDIVYLELPEVGEVFDHDDVFGVVESVKTTSDLYTPLSGTVLEINDSLIDSPATVNDDPYGEGWMIRIKIKDHSEEETLLNLAGYEKFVAEEDHD